MLFWKGQGHHENMQVLYIARSFKTNICKDKFSSALDSLPKGGLFILSIFIVMLDRHTEQARLESINQVQVAGLTDAELKSMCSEPPKN